MFTYCPENEAVFTLKDTSCVMVSPSDNSRKDECDWFAAVMSQLGDFPGNESGGRCTFFSLFSRQRGDFGNNLYVCHVCGLK